MSDKIPRYVPALELSTVNTATTYHFRRVDRERSGWALCTVNDGTGELSIQSDWGNFSFRWNVNHLGRPSLTHFIGDRADCHYLADKLTSRSERDQFDADATVTKMLKMLCARRLEEGRAYLIGWESCAKHEGR